MKFETIQEEKKTINVPFSKKSAELNKLIQKIKSDCTDFLHYEPSLVYRGIGGLQSNSFGKKDVRIDRKPRDISPKVHEILNDIFEDIFGYRLRQEALFASRSWSMAGSYGIHGNGINALIFPIGEYHIVASKKVDDLYSSVISRPVRLTFNKEMSKEVLVKKFGKVVDDFELIKYADWIQSAYLSTIFTRPTDIDTGRPERLKVIETVNEYLIGLLKKFIYKHYDFEDNITVEKSEIMILCDSYYFIDLDIVLHGRDIDSLKRMSPSSVLKVIEDELKSGLIDL